MQDADAGYKMQDAVDLSAMQKNIMLLYFTSFIFLKMYVVRAGWFRYGSQIICFYSQSIIWSPVIVILRLTWLRQFIQVIRFFQTETLSQQ